MTHCRRTGDAQPPDRAAFTQVLLHWFSCTLFRMPFFFHKAMRIKPLRFVLLNDSFIGLSSDEANRPADPSTSTSLNPGATTRRALLASLMGTTFSGVCPPLGGPL